MHAHPTPIIGREERARRDGGTRVQHCRGGGAKKKSRCCVLLRSVLLVVVVVVRSSVRCLSRHLYTPRTCGSGFRIQTTEVVVGVGSPSIGPFRVGPRRRRLCVFFICFLSWGGGVGGKRDARHFLPGLGLFLLSALSCFSGVQLLPYEVFEVTSPSVQRDIAALASPAPGSRGSDFRSRCPSFVGADGILTNDGFFGLKHNRGEAKVEDRAYFQGPLLRVSEAL